VSEPIRLTLKVPLTEDELRHGVMSIHVAVCWVGAFIGMLTGDGAMLLASLIMMPFSLFWSGLDGLKSMPSLEEPRSTKAVHKRTKGELVDTVKFAVIPGAIVIGLLTVETLNDGADPNVTLVVAAGCLVMVAFWMAMLIYAVLRPRKVTL
jgi:hypothetical protein